MARRGRNISWVERVAAQLGIVPGSNDPGAAPPTRHEDGTLSYYPPLEKWDDWEEPSARREKRRYALVPTTCFNCEAACGLLAYVDRETGTVRKIEGNPLHPGSRGRNCAKGPATINQMMDPERILEPLKRKGPRGCGQWERVSWDEALDDIAGRIRRAFDEGRGREVMYHVGRPGHEGFMERLLGAWKIDGHNSHTNICSASARLGYQMSVGYDRPSPDYANAKLILLISAHLESGHYFNPHAQRIIEAKQSGARLVVLDPRLSNTAARADLWLPVRPGTETAVLLAVVRLLLERDAIAHAWVRDWVDWRGFLRARHPADTVSYDQFLRRLAETYDEFTPEFAAREAGIEADQVRRLATEIAAAGSRVACHVWRSAATGNEYGWQVSRCLSLLNALTGSLGVEGGTGVHGWHKFKPKFWSTPDPVPMWNEMQWPREYPLSFYEMSILLPHFALTGRGKLDTYFTRVYNPCWTNPDGFQWIEFLRDESRLGLHVALTPTWNESAYFADYVLPTGHSTERHDIQSQETHAGVWVAFRQPVLRAYAERRGQRITDTREVNPGEVWEEDEFWIDLTWRIDPDGSLGIRRHYESPYRAGEKITVDEYYQWIFENAVPGLPEEAAQHGWTPLEYMRRIGVFEVKRDVFRLNADPVAELDDQKLRVDAKEGLAYRGETLAGVVADGKVRAGWATPSKRVEVHSSTLADWGFADHAIPWYSKSHVGPHALDPENGVYCLVPTYRLPTMIHTRSGNAKWLAEISHANPVLMHPETAERHDIRTGDLVRVSTDIGHFVNRALVTEGMRPETIACSHHMGRWRLDGGPGSRWNSATVRIENLDTRTRRLRIIQPTDPFESKDRDSERIWWKESGVNQNLAFPVNPDPASGMHCWHQVVRLSKAEPDDQYGDVVVDLEKSLAHYEEWLAKTKPAKPGGLRRPKWLPRPLKPAEDQYEL
ncbi:MAG: molybdopterin-dependent oxidoreductase [Planctomycetes bacterium]|nr:molybdopterin-dependent oxidoreductase [Planctomycetota bacterium]